jgi:hypothetical protein
MKKRSLVILVLLLLASLATSACGGGGGGDTTGGTTGVRTTGGNTGGSGTSSTGSTGVQTGTPITGFVSAPHGTGQAPTGRTFHGTGCFGVAGATVSLRQVSNHGGTPQLSGATFTVTTDANGNYTIPLNNTLALSGDLVVEADGADSAGNTFSYRAFVSNTFVVDLNPATEAAFELALRSLDVQGVDISTVSVDAEVQLEVDVENTASMSDYSGDTPDSAVQTAITAADADDTITTDLDALTPAATGLSGTYSGNYNLTYQGTSPACQFNDSGTLTLVFNGQPNGQLGTLSGTGFSLLHDDCSLDHVSSVTGDIGGSSSPSQVIFTLTVTLDDGEQLSFSGTGNVSGNSLSGSFSGGTFSNANGSFSLTLQ